MSDACSVKPFNKVLVANRGEIAIRIFRALTELEIKTVAIYSEEDRLQLHRYKADEAYLIGRDLSPIDAYLCIDQIIELAKAHDVDAIHPGYGFLSENANFAKACADAGIKFIGPTPEILQALGDKISARNLAISADIPVIPGTDGAITTEDEALSFARAHGYPLIIKAAMGGGGRGMTIVRDESQLVQAIARSQAEAKASFGSAEVFIERYLEKPRHIEIQILGDAYGNLVHLFERDCSIQRRHQKVVEVAPAQNLSQEIKQRLYDDAIKICQSVNYVNAGTVEFLVDQEGRHYFIEVNPRVQVEHTITEIITGRDIVQSQIRIAEGYPLDHDTIRIQDQSKVKKSGYAIQLRITTEDPANGFSPDTGKLTAFRAGEGFGIRLDAAAFEGAVISPHYDSLLIKACAWNLDFDLAVSKAVRALREFRIRGVKTNIGFLENLISHPDFHAGKCDTTFIESHPELFEMKPRLDRANKLLRFLGELSVNGFTGIERNYRPAYMPTPIVPKVPSETAPPSPAYAAFKDGGAKGLSEWIKSSKALLVTDTTMRDAHQSLFATRLRTQDMLRVAHETSHLAMNMFSQEMWGGATFDVAMRFLHEDPWHRLRKMRQLMPGTLLQMLIRSGNAVGYKNYPDNVVNAFIRKSAENGIDIFRIFDCLNWVESMKPCIEAVAATGKIAEAAICYSGDVSDSSRTRFPLAYYRKLAKELEASGAHILAIKDMAGLLKPKAATVLVKELKDAVDLPIHLHTHDTSGNGVATLLAAADAGVDIVDGALSSMAGLTSQPSLNAVVAALSGTDRAPELDMDHLQLLSDYWENVREAYAPFECGLKAGTADVYRHEIPGGQYSNLRPQAISVGLGDRWNEVKSTYHDVNKMLGGITKVTPSSKAVGDMALFMVQNNLTPNEVIEKGMTLSFPDSIVSLLQGMMGQNDVPFNPDLVRVVIKDNPKVEVRPGTLLEQYDFESSQKELAEAFPDRVFSEEDLISYALYPKVSREFWRYQDKYGDVSVLETPTFFYGLEQDVEELIPIEEGKTLIVKLMATTELHKDGTREVFFELNGRARQFNVIDENSGVVSTANEVADPDNKNQVQAPMNGKLAEVFVKVGDEVKEGDKLLTTEAMKMLNVVTAHRSGRVARLPLSIGANLKSGDLLLEFEA